MLASIDRGIVVALLAAFLAGPAWAVGHPHAPPARLQSHLVLPSPYRILQQDSTFACFEGLLSVLLNPGCFVTPTPPRPGDCVSAATDFMVQYIFPDVPTDHRVIGFGFLSNDDDTVFPSAGVFQFPIDQQGFVRFPTSTELANLPVTQIETFGDTSVVFVDVESENIIVEPGATTALVVALQFPQGGEQTGVGLGPGIGADADHPDQACDVFTVDGGVTWYEPAPCSPSDPTCEPLDWGFVVLMRPVDPVESITWSNVKSFFRTP